jgi:membrane fusion protein, multidrug efflux system
MNAPQNETPSNNRRLGLTVVACTVLIVALGYSGWHWFNGRHQEDTDNAYVSGNVVQITPQISGTVTSIEADEADMVKAGQVLLKMDPMDAKLSLEQAQEQLGQAVREVKALFDNNQTLTQQIKVREADVAKAQNELAKAQSDLARRTPLSKSGSVGQEEIEHANELAQIAKHNLDQSLAALEVAKDQLLSSQSQTKGTTVYDHPSVKRAASKVREAFLAVHRTDIVSPIDAHVAKRYVQLGQRVNAGAALMTLVSLDQLWVDANFKEVQLKNIHLGQSVTLESDLYGSQVIYHGKIAALGSGTGSAFALLPAQNATGNWIKIVQRVPVRIALDPQELRLHPLRIGLSMEVSVDTSDQTGPLISTQPRAQALSSTQAYETDAAQAQSLVQRIIHDNL